MTPELERHLPYAEALYDALKPDPFYIGLESLVADQDKAREAMLGYYCFSIAEAAEYGFVIFPGFGAAGVSVWSHPLPASKAEKKAAAKHAFIEESMGPECLWYYHEVGGFMSRMTGPLIDAQDWYLSILGLAPSAQGRGRGAGLVTPILEQADRAGIATYLETYTPRNQSFYQRLGYQILDQFEEPVTQKPYWVMRREPEDTG